MYRVVIVRRVEQNRNRGGNRNASRHHANGGDQHEQLKRQQQEIEVLSARVAQAETPQDNSQRDREAELEPRISRASLLKVAAVGAAAVVGSGSLSPKSVAAETDPSTEKVRNVVVTGSSEIGVDVSNAGADPTEFLPSYDIGVKAIGRSYGVFAEAGYNTHSNGAAGTAIYARGGPAIQAIFSGGDTRTPYAILADGGVWGQGQTGLIGTQNSTPPAPPGSGVYGEGNIGVVARGTTTGVVAIGSGGAGVDSTSETGPGITTQSTSGPGIVTQSTSGPAVQAKTGSGVGVDAYSNSRIGIHGSSYSGVGMRGASTLNYGGSFAGGKAQVHLEPSSAASHPSSGSAGDLFVDASSRLWYCLGGSTWKQLA